MPRTARSTDTASRTAPRSLHPVRGTGRRHSLRSIVPTLAGALLLTGLSGAAPATAAVSETVLALAAPLAQQFGVPQSAVSTLLEKGISLESVTELLLVSQSAEKGLDEVTKRYEALGNDIGATAKELDVAASAYSKEAVSAAIDDAKESLQAEATQKATDQVDKAADDANKAIGNALGGFRR